MANRKTNRVTLDQIDGEISTFTTSRKALETHGHNIAMMIIYNCAPVEVSDECAGSGNCSRALKLAKAMPKSWCQGLEDWFKAFTPIRVVAKNGKCEYDPKYKNLSPAEKLTWWKVAEAAENPFYSYEKDIPDEKPALALEALLKMVEQVASRMTKQVEEGKVAEADAPAALLMAADLVALSKKKYRSAARKGAPATANNNKPVDTAEQMAAAAA